MKILFIGDIVARIGRKTVIKLLPDLIKKEDVDFVIANGENMTTGYGMTMETMKDLQAVGVDFFTSGNHIWKKQEFIPELDNPKTPVIRPANYPLGAPGRGFDVVKTPFGNVGIINMIGLEGFLNANLDSPFRLVEGIIEELKKKAKIIIVDFHADISSEKVAFGLFLDGKVTAVFGTHTHVPTADARVLPKGTAVVTDVGMVGPQNTSLGVKSEIVIKRFLTCLPQKHDIPTEGPVWFNSVLIDADNETGKAKSIKRIDLEDEI
ncbi:MAG: Metallophosphoesterase [candidate division CPR2 bacterium GW2011_GWC1_39_9]|uniref:Metallophosphoesterase n=1 Tax=candidate division CPR2 bacterium GW2011_GWC2_39_10 TaxID=1618345 RepID=A0A0G0PZR8_UNCC2|nr:MAG: Metallophosphoesterase [candidate division CPR2 bacterium GW2011_GWC2_39_10]KKR36013.1 MAG: Metallophosphoesterase [candidate division CPR2 bacterium GW2011_GWC1_39_9]